MQIDVTFDELMPGVGSRFPLSQLKGEHSGWLGRFEHTWSPGEAAPEPDDLFNSGRFDSGCVIHVEDYLTALLVAKTAPGEAHLLWDLGMGDGSYAVLLDTDPTGYTA